MNTKRIGACLGGILLGLICAATHAALTDEDYKQLGNTLTPYRGSGLNGIYGAGGGGVANLAREIGQQYTRDGRTPTNTLVRAYLVNWLRASATGGRGGRGAGRRVVRR